MAAPATPSPATLEGFEPFLIELHKAAMAETLPRFRAGAAMDDKGGAFGFDPVTAADRGAEQAIRRLIAERHPDHGVIGEEGEDHRPDADWVWVLDPVDGTRAFVSGVPLWTTLIGLRFQGAPMLGSIGQPYIGELYLGHAGGSRLMSRGGSRPLSVRPCPRLTEATLASTDPYAYFGAPQLAAWNQVRAAARLAPVGGDGYLFALLAAGSLDLIVEAGLKPWDIEPCIPVILGAGGVVTDWLGDPYIAGGQVAASGDRACLDDALVALRRAAQ